MYIPPLTPGLLVFLVGLVLTGVLIQPVILNLSASLVGEKAPGWWKGVAMLLVGGASTFVTGLVYTFTLGLVISRLGTVPSVLGALAVSWLTSSIVYSAFLRISVARAAVVASAYWFLSSALLIVLGIVAKVVLG